MDFKKIYETTLKYDHNVKWVFLFEDVKTRDFFVDYIWDDLESGSLSDIIKWTPKSREGFANAITKVGGSKNGKSVLLYRDPQYRPLPGKSFDQEAGVESGGLNDYVRNLIERGKFDDAVRELDGTEKYSRDGDWPATIKSGLVDTPVSGKAIVSKLVKKCISMMLSSRQPGDEREQSAFYVGSSSDDGELHVETESEKAVRAIEFLRGLGYEVSGGPTSLSESIDRTDLPEDVIDAVDYIDAHRHDVGLVVPFDSIDEFLTYGEEEDLVKTARAIGWK